MLLDFSVENWMSYKDGASLSLVGTRERQHGHTLAKVPRFRSMKVLPVAAIYGGNASGKTAMFMAIQCLQTMVVMPVGVDALIPVRPFLLDGESPAAPTSFDVTFMTNGVVYRLEVEAAPESITYECLEILKEHDVSVGVYERKANMGENSFTFNESFFADADMTRFVYRGTRPNQLFVNNAVQQNLEELQPVYHWFNSVLDLVGVESQPMIFARCCTRLDGFLDYAGNALSRLDTGIVGLVAEPVDASVLPSDDAIKRQIAQLAEGNLLTLTGERSGDYGFDMFTVQRTNGEIEVDRLRTEHLTPGGQRVRFELYQESSGTQRLMQLLPMLFYLVHEGAAAERVFIVDELDRCLHTMLTKQLIRDFLSVCDEDTRKQLLFTTHDLLLMDQGLMRRDEMYIAQRDADGCSELVGLAEYKDIRFDKDIVRSYLDGRFGGVPMLSEAGAARG